MSTLLFGVIPDLELPAIDSLPDIDGVEIRLDRWPAIDRIALRHFIENCPLPVMLTLRRKDQGGDFLGTEEERLALLESLCAYHPAYVDLEYDIPILFRKRLYEAYPKIAFLSSYHDFKHTPDDLEALYAKVKTPFASIYKIAVTATSSIDALRMLAFIHKHSAEDKLIGICMGEKGQITRTLAPIVGGYLTYAALSAERTSAPGQLLAQEMQDTYHFRKLNRQTRIYALLGDPIDKSLGHIIHNGVFQKQNINAVYVKIPLKSEEISDFVALARTLPFDGFSITMPLKEAILPHLDAMTPETHQIGASNTIQVIHGKWIGYNTDGIGAMDALEKRHKIRNKHIVFIGAGGAAKALIAAAVNRGAKVTVINRTSHKAADLAKEVNGRGGGWDLWPEVCKENYDILVNCIPEGEAIEECWILPGKTVMDIVYVPKQTPFLEKAERNKCHLVFGHEMFAGQALEQEKIWLSKSLNSETALEIIDKLLQQQFGSPS